MQLDFSEQPHSRTAAQPHDFRSDLPALTPEESRVLSYIRTHLGREKAIDTRSLEQLLDMPGRKIRKHVNRLRSIHCLPIGSATGSPAGYYWMTDPQEIEEAASWLHSFGIKQLVNACRLRGLNKYSYIDQVALELREELA